MKICFIMLFLIKTICSLKIEEEINTLRQALDRKEKHLADLKRELGITTWSQLRTGLENQYHQLQTTQM